MVQDIESVVTQIIDAAVKLHMRTGPGLSESAYKKMLTRDIRARGLTVRREVAAPFVFEGRRYERALRLDLLVNDIVPIEVKAVSAIIPAHVRQLVTYLNLLKLPLGVLLNFGAPRMKDGIRRVVNNYLSVT